MEFDANSCQIGASWYPEIWPESAWAEDLDKMLELGFTQVRLFEFAWHRLQPNATTFDLDWAGRVIDLCQARGIGVMIGTPTASPPAWLTTTHPQTLRTLADGRVTAHGGRCHFNFHDPLYRELAGQLIERVAQRFGRHPALVGWQIDNEMGGTDHSPATRAAFHDYLRQRFGSIDRLNAAWGLELWSQAYDNFAQVPLPPPPGSHDRPHPSLSLAGAAFQTAGWRSYIDHQVAIIRRHSDRPISTNQVGLIGNMDWPEVTRSLDRLGVSMYADRRYYHYNLPRFDALRAGRWPKPFWLLETAPNWSGGHQTWNIHMDGRGPGLFTWMSTLLGGSLTLFWQWREHWAGQEMLHGTCRTATGRWRPGREAWMQTAAQLRRLGPWLAAHPPLRAGLALMMSGDAAYAWAVEPSDEDMDYAKRFLHQLHLPLCQAGLWRDVIDVHTDLTPYKVVCLPLMPQVPDQLRQRLRPWVEAGGTLVLGPLSGWRTAEHTCFLDRELGGLEDLIGADVALRFTAQWAEDSTLIAFSDGRTSRSKTLCDGFAPGRAEVVARWQGGYGDGLAAIVRNRLGRGTVLTLGGIVDTPTWIRLITEACAAVGIVPWAQAPADVVVVPRGADGRLAGLGLANLAGEARTVRLPVAGHDLIADRPVGTELRLDPFQPALIAFAHPG